MGIEFEFNLQVPCSPNKLDVSINLSKCDIKSVNTEMMELFSETDKIDRNTISTFMTQLSESITKNSSKYKKTWYKHELPNFIVKMIKIKKQLYRQIKATEASHLKKQYNLYNKQIHQMILQYREPKWITTCKEINDMKGKNFWQKIKQISKYKGYTTIPDLINSNQVFTTDKEKADLFADILEETYKQSHNKRFDSDNFNMVSKWNTEFFKHIRPELDVPIITMEEYYKVLLSGKNSSPGKDPITRAILRELDPSLHEKIVEMYNYCLKHSFVPHEWKASTIITIPKPKLCT